MSYILNGVTLKAPNNMDEDNSTQFAQQRTLGGTVGRDYFGSNKRVWSLDYTNTNPTDFTAMNTIYQSYLSSGTAQSWSVSEGNYVVNATTVHVDLTQRKFSVGGTTYLSDFTLVLTEA